MTNEDFLIAAAYQVALDAHWGQTDKSGKPYILHPVRVALIVKEHGYDPLVAVAALLHDVVEDTDVTLADLEETFPLLVTEAVDALTHRKGEPREDYIARIKTNEIATAVKLADIADNTDPARVAALSPEDQVRLEAKYTRDLAQLSA